MPVENNDSFNALTDYETQINIKRQQELNEVFEKSGGDFSRMETIIQDINARYDKQIQELKNAQQPKTSEKFVESKQGETIKETIVRLEELRNRPQTNEVARKKIEERLESLKKILNKRKKGKAAQVSDIKPNPVTTPSSPEPIVSISKPAIMNEPEEISFEEINETSLPATAQTGLVGQKSTDISPQSQLGIGNTMQTPISNPESARDRQRHTKAAKNRQDPAQRPQTRANGWKCGSVRW